MKEKFCRDITEGKTYLGIELGSTRIKAVLVTASGEPIASGGHDWENKFENNIWTYSLEDVRTGITDCFSKLKQDVRDKYGVPLTQVSSIGISAMMHGYLAFDKDDNLLVPFRTWRNTMTDEAASRLTKEFNFNIPQRWSIAHLYGSMLNNENHIDKISKITTLSGYVHYLLTGEFVLGVGDASGVFPIDSETNDYEKSMIEKFNQKLAEKGLKYRLEDILPKVLATGENAGVLTEQGAKLLDPAGEFKAGAPLCPPEGDAGTGMVATNSISERTGNVSAGTSIFAMIVLEKPLSKVYEQIDIVTTPTGKPVAMVHCNNGSSDIDAWANLFVEFSKLSGNEMSKGKVLDLLFETALSGDSDCGGLFSCNYISGEHITGFSQGRPLFARTQNCRFNLSNFFRNHLYSAVSSLKVGMNILQKENVKIDRLLGHGGYFKARDAGQTVLASATGAPVSVMETAGEGGSYGVALLASYMMNKNGRTLDEFLNQDIFKDSKISTIVPTDEQISGFEKYFDRYLKGLNIEAAAVESLE